MLTDTDIRVTVVRGATTAALKLSTGMRVAVLGDALLQDKTFTEAFPSSMSPSTITVKFSTGAEMDLAELAADAADMTLGDMGGDFTLICSVDEPPMQLYSLKVFNVGFESTMCEIKMVQTASAADLLAELGKRFTGELSDTKLYFPGKSDKRELKAAFSESLDASLLERISSKITMLPPMLRPAEVDCVSKLQLELPNGAQLITGETTGGNGMRLQLEQCASLRAQVLTSCKSAKLEPNMTLKACGILEANTGCFAEFCEETATTKPRSGKAPEVKKIIRFECKVCKDNIRNKDSAHGGTLRHLCGDKHLKKLALLDKPGLKDQELEDAALAWARAVPEMYTKLRKANTTQAKSALAKKEVAQRVAAATQVLTGERTAAESGPVPAPMPMQGLSPAEVGAAIARGF